MRVYKASNADILKIRADLLVVGVYEGNSLTPQAKQIDKALGGALKSHIARARSIGWQARRQFAGRLKDATTMTTLGAIGAKEVLVVGLGPAFGTSDQIRRASGVAGRQSGSYKSVALALPDGSAELAVEGFELGAYDFAKYRTKQPRLTERVTVVGATVAEIDRAMVYAEATTWARNLVNDSPSGRGPAVVAELVKQRLSGRGIKVEVFDEKALAAQGLNGILTVGRGSSNPARFVVMTYEPKGATGFIGLIGKGITFDSGGLSLKQAAPMETMKLDCGGAAAVVGAMGTLKELNIKTKVVAAIALAENMPGGDAVKPGDIIRHYGGRTSEVLNTDAEGRLVLADALAWMSEQEPDVMVDIATLTGGMMVALGLRYAGFFSTDDDLANELQAASTNTGEPLWRMPLVDEYRPKIDSEVADVKNSAGTPNGAPIFGALFLRDF
ncbi:MAG: leucyl aminopeptidase, partial [Actinomycetota bacterium]